MRPTLITAFFLSVLLACGGGGSSSPAPAPAPVVSGFSIKTNTKTTAAPQAEFARAEAVTRMATTGAVTVNPADLALLFGLKTNETGDLVCGYSGSRDSQAFNISVVTPNGATVANGKASQTFPFNDPSIINNTLMGTGSIDIPGDMFGLFMAQFSATGSTIMNMTPGMYVSGVGIGGSTSVGALTQVDEMMIRCTQDSMPIADANGNKGTLVTSPHFVGAQGTYCDLNNTLTVNGIANFAPIGYFMFMPASKIGIGANFFVSGAGVIDPVANGADYDKTGTPTNPATWTLKDPLAWINDPGCAGLLAVANQVVASNPNTNLLAVATYFESYFAKFDAAQSALFSTTTGNLVGDAGAISFSIIALDDLPNGAGTTPVPMPLNNHSTINLVWDATNTAYALNSGVLDLEGAPPIQFATAIVPAPVIVSFVATNAIPAVLATATTPLIPAVAATITPVFTDGTGTVNGVAVTSGATIIETPTATTTYTLQVVGITGMTVTATATITVK